VTAQIRGGAWRSAAACVGTGPILFYDPSPLAAAEAKRVCSSCPVAVECRTYARRTGEPFGIWGGETEVERAAARTDLVAAGSSGPAPVVTDAELVDLLGSANPRMRAIEVLRRQFDLKPDVAYKYLVRAMRLGLVERRGRNLYPARRA
jgi:WhiB family transcriptional regulator, redox-sensing transcriptional regulator